MIVRLIGGLGNQLFQYAPSHFNIRESLATLEDDRRFRGGWVAGNGKLAKRTPFGSQ